MAVSTCPTSGRIVMRLLPDGSGALLGVLRFPVQFRVLESAGYLFCLSRRGARIYNPPYDAGPPADVDGWGINASLRSPQWPVFLAHPEFMLVRFIAAFPKQNVWAVYGAARLLPITGSSSPGGPVWFDVVNGGQFEEIAAPAQGDGLSCSQLLTDLCVWPDARGRQHCLPQHPSRWRPVYLRFSKLTAQVGEGTLCEAQFYQRVRADAKLKRVAPLHLDLEFARYLARIKVAGGLRLSRPMTTQQKKARHALAARILRDMRGAAV